MTCLTEDRMLRIRELEQVAGYREHLRKHPKLIYLFFELTDRCNMSCLHCGSSCSTGNQMILPVKDIEKVLDETAERYDAGKIMVCLTGGEPMLHPDFYKIANLIQEKGFLWGMTTNGSLIDDAAACALAEAGLGSVSVSLDGFAEDHDFLRNRKGAFEMAVHGIRSLQKCGKYRGILQVTTVVHRKNIGRLEEMYGYLKKMGITHWRLTNMDPIGRAEDHSDLLLDRKGFLTLLSFIREKRFCITDNMEVTFGCAHYLTPQWEKMVRDHYFLCGAGINIAGVLCNGDIYSCFDIERRPELVQGNVKKDNFCDVWENRFHEYRRDRTSSCEMCRNCPESFLCGGDSFHTWDFERNRPGICLKQNVL